MKPLTLMAPLMERPELAELRRMETADEHPRTLLYEETLNSDVLYANMLKTLPSVRRRLYKFLHNDLAIALEGFLRRRTYDVVISWGPRYAILYASLLKITKSQTPHVGLIYWFSKPNIAKPLRMLHSHIDWIVTWNSVQRDYAVNELGIPASKIKLIPHFVDQQFWRPIHVETNTICAAGQEMRDYDTLFQAMRGLDINCHIAAGKVRVIGKLFATHKDNSEIGYLPPTITVGKLSYSGLRALFARSRFVVVPLLPTDTDNGVTVILEAMAMGKAVICTRTKGQVDVIQENKTGIFVPPGDPKALRDAIEYLWNNPEIAEKMGREARKHVEAHHTLEGFIYSVKEGVEQVVARARKEKRVTFRFIAPEKYTYDAH